MNTQINVNHTFLESPRPNFCKHSGGNSGWQGQFACPTGRLGRFAGHLMAIKNSKMNDFAIDVLEVRSEDQILEIGFGHGKTIRKIAENAHRGFVAGVDISEVMVQQATRRNREFIENGRVELCHGSVTNIPYEYARFNKVLAVNSFQFWPNAELNLDEIRRVMCEGGMLVLCLRMHSTSSFAVAPGFTEEEVDEVAGLVRWVGFRDIQTQRKKIGREVTCITAINRNNLLEHRKNHGDHGELNGFDIPLFPRVPRALSD